MSDQAKQAAQAKIAVMFPSQLKQTIALTHKMLIERALYIEGSPGLGKSKIVEQVAKELGVGFACIHAPLLQPEDYSFPLPNMDRTSVEFIVSKTKFPIVGSNFPEFGIFLIDELAQADQAAQKILAGLIYDRNINGVPLLPGWTIVATGNRQQDRAGASRLLSHLADRVTPIELQVNLDDWTNWAIGAGVPLEVIAFARFRPDLLNTFDPQQERNATPRAWVLGIAEYLQFPAELQRPLICACVGEGPGTEFLAFLNVWRNLPNPDAILLAPDKADLPTDAATKYAISGALVHRVTPANFGRALTYMQRVGPEFGVLFVRDALSKDKRCADTAEFIAWSSGDGAKLLT